MYHPATTHDLTTGHQLVFTTGFVPATSPKVAVVEEEEDVSVVEEEAAQVAAASAPEVLPEQWAVLDEEGSSAGEEEFGLRAATSSGSDHTAMLDPLTGHSWISPAHE